MVDLAFLLDTNVLSEPIRPRPDPGVKRSLERHRSCIATAAPVWYELETGCARLPRSNRRRVIEDYLRGLRENLPVLPYDREAATWHARECARIRRLGAEPGGLDLMIASIAATRGLVLVTRNLAEFRHLPGLLVESWWD